MAALFETKNGLSGALNAIRDFQSVSGGPTNRPADDSLHLRSLECRSAVSMAGWILESALRHRESRGVHFRENFPQSDDARWAKHQQISLGPDGSTIWKWDNAPASQGKDE